MVSCTVDPTFWPVSPRPARVQGGKLVIWSNSFPGTLGQHLHGQVRGRVTVRDGDGGDAVGVKCCHGQPALRGQGSNLFCAEDLGQVRDIFGNVCTDLCADERVHQSREMTGKAGLSMLSKPAAWVKFSWIISPVPPLRAIARVKIFWPRATFGPGQSVHRCQGPARLPLAFLRTAASQR